MAQEHQHTPELAQEDHLLAHPTVIGRRADWQRLTETRQPSTEIKQTLNREETAALMDWMRHEARRQKRWRHTMSGMMACFGVGFIAILIGHYFWGWNVAGYAGLLNLAGVLYLTTLLAWNSEAHRKKLAALSNITDVNLVGPMCEIAVSANRDMRVLAQDALIRLLPRLRPSDAAGFTAEQRTCLYTLLYSNDIGLVRVILNSLEQIGDDKALPYVQNLATGKYLAGRDLRARVIAERCLPLVEERARQYQISQTLLRPAPVGSGETLLRAAEGASNTAPTQLLRAASGERDDS